MSLGWLAESSFLPRKRKLIEGVSQNSLVNLKAAVLDLQQASKKQRTTPRVEKTPLGGKNKGIENRIQKDLIALRSEKTKSHDMLVKKAAMYEKLVRGELESISEFEDQQPLVDFEQKLIEVQDEDELQPEPVDPFLVQLFGKEISSNLQPEKIKWEPTQAGGLLDEQRRNDFVHALKSEAEKTKQARDAVKAMRNKKRNKTKKRIAKLKALKSLQQTAA